MVHHSAAVHIPLALSILLPVMYIVIEFSIKRGWFSKKTWLLVWGLAGVQVISSWLAYQTGARDRALSSADAAQLSVHADLAFYFILIWLAVLILLPISVFAPRIFSVISRGALLLLLAFQLAMAIRLGMTGGEIVFGV